MRQTIYTAVVFIMAALPLSATSHAAVEIQGDVSALRVTASGDSISDVLAAISKIANLRYRTSVQLQTVISGSYSGSAESVIARLLSDYSFAMSHNGKALEVSIYGRWLAAAGAQSTPAPASAGLVPLQRAVAPQPGPAVPVQRNPQRETRYEHFRLIPSSPARAAD